MRNIYRLLTIITTLFLISCGSTLPKVKPYKMDIQQGNVVTSEMLLKLRPGMTKSQVNFIMGTPLLVDSFRTNRWDYFYQLRKQGKIVKQHRVILDFENDLLKRVRGDVVPKGQTVDDVTKKLQEEAKQQSGITPVEPTTSDAQEPTVVPIEAPAAEVTDQMAEEAMPSEEAAETPPSVLAVPLAVEPEPTVEPVQPSVAPDVQNLAPEIEKPEVGKSEIEKPEVEQIESQVEEKVEAVKQDVAAPVEAAVEEPAAQVEKTAEEAVESMPAPVVTPQQPQQNQPKTNRDKRVFRLDRQLDTSRVKPAEAAAASTDSAVKEVVETAEESLPEEDPSLFERMLEKIGF